MSHVDEGRLHAWLDGAYEEPALAEEGREVAEHLATCASCRAALERERALRERAGGVLRAASPEVGAPAWEEVLARRQAATPATSPRRRRIPVAWAASVVLAVGAGWIASRELMREPAGRTQAESDAMMVEQGAAPSVADPMTAVRQRATDGDAGAGAPARGEAGGVASQAGQRLRDATEADRPQAMPFSLESRREAAAPALAERKAMEGEELAIVSVPGAELLRDYDRAVLGDAWQDTTAAAATDVLGRVPAALEGASVESVQVAQSEQGRAVRVVQRLDPFTLLELVQRREPEAEAALGRAANLEAAPTPDSLFVLAADPDRGAAVVSLRRGDITLLLRAPVSVDSLRALAARIRE